MRESFIYIYVNKRNEKGIHERSLGMEKLLLPRFGIVCKYLVEVFEYKFVSIWVVNVDRTTGRIRVNTQFSHPPIVAVILCYSSIDFNFHDISRLKLHLLTQITWARLIESNSLLIASSNFSFPTTAFRNCYSTSNEQTSL